MDKTRAKFRQLGNATQLKVRSYSYIGLWASVAFYAIAQLPSLLPRDWYLQALIGGFSIAIGYGVGVGIRALALWAVEKDSKEKTSPKAWKVLYIFAPAVMVAATALGWQWQNEIRSLMDIEAANSLYLLRILLVSIFIGWGLVALARRIQALYRVIQKKTSIRLPRRISILIALVLTYAIVVWVASGVFFSFLITQADRMFEYRNRESTANIVRPTAPLQTGSDESLISWDGVGRQGRTFIAGGPTAADIESVTGENSLEPIRVYVGVDNADSTREQASLAVDELKRTNAFDREFLIIAIPTGTGWIEPKTMDAVEYLHLGDTATVAIQYSYLPSWLSFLVDQQRAQEAGIELFDAVYDEWKLLPEEDRPTLLTFGLSLGSFGSQGSFSSSRDMVRAIDGALYQGTPNDTQLWRDITDARDSPSPEWQPVYNQGESIRFASSNDDIASSIDSWDSDTRVLFLQHASDPIVWFSFDLIHQKPDWLNETRGPDVNSTVRWYPFITFIQIAVDQMIGNSVPVGHGHLYENTAVYSWAAITHMNDWEFDELASLQKNILER